MKSSITPYQLRYEIRHSIALKLEARRFKAALEEANSAFLAGSILAEDVGFVEMICNQAKLRKSSEPQEFVNLTGRKRFAKDATRPRLTLRTKA
ncbi:MAG: hypothetical protein ACAI35_14435 [Candidatus Methylacidiphilales bacterium]|nr:hypothetical protein [Candidatus Methylacidiphilales bacterium]